MARAARVSLVEIDLKLPWLSVSSLVDRSKSLPDTPLSKIGRGAIPSTYVPARNSILLALAASLADARGARAVVLGANCLDSSGYPDCRPGFLRAFDRVLARGTRAGVEGKGLAVLAPLLKLDKAGIVRLARKLEMPMGLTWSCYRGGRRPCGTCDSCRLRAKGFQEAGMEDPA